MVSPTEPPPPCTITLVMLGEKPQLIERASREDLRKALSQETPFWVDFSSFSQHEASILSEDFQLHPLTVQDCLDEIHYPKIELFPNYLFVIIHAVENHGKRELTEEVDFFVMGKVLGTVRLHSCRPMESIRKKLLEGGVQARTPYMLFHAIASHFMDEYFPLLDTLNQQIEEIEDRIFQKPREGQKKPIKSSNGETLAKFLSTKKRISRLRRTLTPQRDVFGRLARDEFPFISKQAMVYFRDIYDQLMRTTEIIDGFRDMLSSMLEAHLSLASNRLNEVMKLFTVVTVIFLPLMFITGVYGMNFKFMPELEKPWGYPTTLGAMALLIVGLIWYFKRRRWL